MFSSRITKAITVGEFEVTIRALSGRAKARAQEAVIEKAAGLLQRVGGADVIQQITAMGGERAVRDAAERDPASSYDQTSVLTDGIVSWTAPEPVDAETIDDLDADAADTLFRAILTLSKVAVSADAAAAIEAEAKNA